MKSFFAILLVVFFAISANAQSFKFGIHGGVDAATFRLSGTGGGQIKYKSGLTGGVGFEGVLGKVAGISIEANYSRQGTGVSPDFSGASTGSFNLEYVTVPVLLQLYATPALHFFAGPQVGFLLSAKSLSTNQPNQDFKDMLESTDFYGVLGGTYEFANGINIGARFNHGLTNIVKEPATTSFKNQYYSFRIGYKFSL